MVGYKLSKNDWVTPFFVIFRSVREKLLVTVFLEHPVVYLHCIEIQRIYIRYDDMADYLHYIQLQFGIEPPEDSWRSKERHIFIIKDLDS